jgi:signal transduction histidine kinase
MPLVPVPVSIMIELAVLGLGMCFALAALFAVVARALHAPWATQLGLGFGAYGVAYLVVSLHPALTQANLQVNATVIGLPYLLLTEGIWARTSAGGAHRDRHYWVTLALIPVAIGGIWAGLLDYRSAIPVAALVWLSWVARFALAARRQPGSGFAIDAVACLVYPVLGAMSVTQLLPAGLSRVPGVMSLSIFGFALLTTSVLSSHREAVAARSRAESELRQRVQAEAALRALNETLEARIAERTAVLLETIEGLESFNRSVSHDLRGPLGGMAGVAELARGRIESGDAPGASRLLDALARQAKASFEAVDALLWLARSRGAPMSIKRVDTARLVQEVCESMRSEAGASELPVSASALPTIEGDAALLRQLFRNLIGNAVKFTRDAPAPQVEVGVTREGGEDVFFVRDNGSGFAAEEAERIFQPFVRASGSGAREGVGVGLSIVRRIVSRHGGWIRAEGAPGRGATFRFTLPGGGNARD